MAGSSMIMGSGTKLKLSSVDFDWIVVAGEAAEHPEGAKNPEKNDVIMPQLRLRGMVSKCYGMHDKP